jgi:hypothetical protein
VEQLERHRDAAIRFLQQTATSWRAALAALVIAASLAGLRLSRRRSRQAGASKVVTAVRRWHSRIVGAVAGSPAREQARRVEFYERFESLLGQLGITRGSSQTQREFAVQAAERLVSTSGEAAVARVPETVADAFYRVRFGNVSLPAGEAQAVDDALGKLERAIAAWRPDARPPQQSRDPASH